jgi:hypothetical protein
MLDGEISGVKFFKTENGEGFLQMSGGNGGR